MLTAASGIGRDHLLAADGDGADYVEDMTDMVVTSKARLRASSQRSISTRYRAEGLAGCRGPHLRARNSGQDEKAVGFDERRSENIKTLPTDAIVSPTMLR